jgi:hypothetical protein
MIFILHKLLMTLATLCLLTGVSAAVFFRHSRYWLKIHKTFNSSAGIFLFTGGIMAVIMIAQQKGEHLEGFHPIVGSIAVGLTVVSLFLGFYQFKATSGKAVVKTLHRWLGRLSVLLIIIALIAGLVRAGII